MTPDPFQSASARLDEIRSQIGTLKVEAREIEDALAVMRRFAAIPGGAIAESKQQRAAERGIEQALWNGAPGFQMSQAFEVVAKEAPSPVASAAITERSHSELDDLVAKLNLPSSKR